MTDRLPFIKAGLQSGDLSHDDIKWAVGEVERLRPRVAELEGATKQAARNIELVGGELDRRDMHNQAARLYSETSRLRAVLNKRDDHV